MSSTTKKTPIDPESQRQADELQTTFDLYREYSEYERKVKEENEMRKRHMASEIARDAEHFINEIDQKEELKEQERQEMGLYILKETQETVVSKAELDNMTHEEIKSIYIKVQDSKKPWYRLLLEFLMGW